MKIIALYPLLREEINFNFLKISILALYSIVDEIYIAVDYPNEDIKFNLNFFKKKKIKIFYLNKSAETKRLTGTPRVELLRLGRKNKGTHFIWLDCDEVFTSPFTKNGRQIISNMKIGQKIQMRWLSMYKNYKYYRNDKKSIWSNLYKDFIVCDSPKYSLVTNVYHEPRTQGPNTLENTIKLDIENGAVMHLQFVNWNNFLLKAAWHMCMETLKMKYNYMSLNRKYFYVYFENFPSLKKIKMSWINHIPKILFNKINIDTQDYWNKRYNFFFKKNYILNFEQLNIWHNDILKKLFIKNTGRKPRLSFLSRLNLFLYCLLEYFRLAKKILFNVHNNVI
jgi:hypothetical protein